MFVRPLWRVWQNVKMQKRVWFDRVWGLLRLFVSCAVLASCHSMWGPFLGENPECTEHPERCQANNNIDGGNADASSLPPGCTPDKWCRQKSLPQDHLYGIWGADANNVWAVGQNGAIQKWNGTTWTKQTSGTSQTLYGVWGADSQNVWAVGGGARSSSGMGRIGQRRARGRQTPFMGFGARM